MEVLQHVDVSAYAHGCVFQVFYVARDRLHAAAGSDLPLVFFFSFPGGTRGNGFKGKLEIISWLLIGVDQEQSYRRHVQTQQGSCAILPLYFSFFFSFCNIYLLLLFCKALGQCYSIALMLLHFLEKL